MPKNKFHKNRGKKHNSKLNEFDGKEKEWGKVKFNPFSRAPRPQVPAQAPVIREHSGEAATPWKNFKNEIIQKQQEESNANKIDLNTDEAKAFLKKRSENYRQMLIAENRKQPTKWENFSDEDEEKSNASAKKEKKNSHGNRKKDDEFDGHDDQPQQKPRALVSEAMLENFDSKKLTFAQNNKIRQIITRTTNLARHESLENAVKELKKRGLKKKKSRNS